jgi:hypothetical protein
MKTLTARFPGTCTECAGKITPGQQILWAKGVKPRHLDCQSTEVAPVPAPRPVTFWCQGAVNQAPHSVTGVPARTVNHYAGKWNGGRSAPAPRAEHWCARCQENEANLLAAYADLERQYKARQYAVVEEGVRQGQSRLSPQIEARLTALVDWEIEQRQAVARRFGL